MSTKRSSTTKNKSTSKKEVVRPVDRYFEEITLYSQNSENRKIQIVFLPLLLLGLMTMIWMIPFPQFEFLTSRGYHIFLNWGSFFIAILIYYYLRLAPTLSYFVLLGIGLMSFIIVQLEYWEKADGPAVWLVGLILFCVSLGMLVFGIEKETKKPTIREFLKILIVGPIWLCHFVFKRFNWKY